MHRDTDIVFKCKYCEIKYTNQKELAIHIKKEHKEKDVTETQEINEDLLNINDKPAKELEILQKQQEKLTSSITEWLSCTECNMKFSNRETLENHKIKHTGDRPYQCSTCGISFGQQFALRAHMKSHIKKVHATTSSETTLRKEPLDEIGVKEVENSINEIIENIIENSKADELKALELSKQVEVVNLSEDSSIKVADSTVDLTKIDKSADSTAVDSTKNSGSTYLETIDSVLQNVAAAADELEKANHGLLAKPKKPLSKTAQKEREKAEQRQNNNRSGSVVYCDICSKLFLNTSTLSRHLKDKHKIVNDSMDKNQSKNVC